MTDYAIYMLDEKGEVASWNAGAERMTGYRADEVIGRPFNNCFTEAELEGGMPERELERAAAEQRVQAEGWCARKDGLRYFANWVVTAVRNPAGKIPDI